LAKYIIQVDLQYEIDHSQTPSHWPSGYLPQGATSPWEPPSSVYGTELFTVNDKLQDRAYKWAKKAELFDSSDVREYCKSYGSLSDVATQGPVVGHSYWCLGDFFLSFSVKDVLISNCTGIQS